jgi:hypothetical protein
MEVINDQVITTSVARPWKSGRLDPKNGVRARLALMQCGILSERGNTVVAGLNPAA